ncbi:putative methyltransferase-domain-containing protein [Lipomyces arxii]|uniref:putative methyltransferase-domain-containing protein n=1 Tax=Lipomyces arxii TaxID=56418 RepID=UPI0034CF77B3
MISDLFSLADRLSSQYSFREFDEYTVWLIILRAVAAWKSRDWSLVDYSPIDLSEDYTVNYYVTVEKELSFMLEKARESMPIALAYYLRSQCLFDRDKPRLAKRDCANFITYHNIYIREHSDCFDDLILFTFSSEASLREIQSLVFQCFYPLFKICETNLTYAIMSVNCRHILSFEDLISKSVEALESDSIGLKFYENEHVNETGQLSLSELMLCRIIPCRPFPSSVISGKQIITAHLALVNEMNLFPHSLIDSDTKIPVTVETIGHSDYTAECIKGPPLTSSLYYPGLDVHGFYGGGQGAVSFTLQINGSHEDIYVKISAVTGIRGTPIIPLIFGPFSIESDTSNTVSTPALYTSRQFYIDEEEYILIKESTSDMSGKIWDSAFWIYETVFNFVSIGQAERLSILDLSSGNGTVGIALYQKCLKYLTDRLQKLDVTITDVEEAQTLLRTNANAVLKKNRGTMFQLAVDELYWGQARKCLPNEPFDVIVACDLIYDNELFDDLLKTLTDLCVPGRTVIFLGYKRRGLSSAEQQSQWKKLGSIFQMDQCYSQESAITGKERLSSEAAGVKLWRMWRLSE